MLNLGRHKYIKIYYLDVAFNNKLMKHSPGTLAGLPAGLVDIYIYIHM